MFDRFNHDIQERLIRLWVKSGSALVASSLFRITAGVCGSFLDIWMMAIAYLIHIGLKHNSLIPARSNDFFISSLTYI